MGEADPQSDGAQKTCGIRRGAECLDGVGARRAGGRAGLFGRRAPWKPVAEGERCVR